MTEPGPKISEFEARLVQMKAELLRAEETGAAAAEPVELDQSRVGRLSRMDALQAQAMSIETNRRRRLQLQKIESALRRIGEGTYGICLRCEGDIAPGRLAADPTVTLCIGCAAGQSG